MEETILYNSWGRSFVLFQISKGTIKWDDFGLRDDFGQAVVYQKKKHLLNKKYEP